MLPSSCQAPPQETRGEQEGHGPCSPHAVQVFCA